MTESLSRWIATADVLRHVEHFGIEQVPIGVTFIRERADDYYTSLVGELFDRMRNNSAESVEWARLGNAFAQFAEDDAGLLTRFEIDKAEAALYGAAAFYCGGFPASAYLSIRTMPQADDDTVRACYDLLVRSARPTSRMVSSLLNALRQGDLTTVDLLTADAQAQAAAALRAGPDEWVPARLYQQLVRRFSEVNVRAVLPERSAGFWDPLIESFIRRTQSTWEFFPSQIQALRGRLLEDGASFALQMPTGAGKTTLCETLLFDHLQRHVENAAILLVPYRSLASELRRTIVRRLNALGISSRCAYGGTVPTGDEVRNLQEARLLVATPEALSGLLSADREFYRRISLVICDEGHLLGAPSRGIGLELLLARLKGREVGAPRFVFISAIVPNIQEINAWLGGTDDTVIRSDYRPALAEFATLRDRAVGRTNVIDLVVHPHLPEPIRFTIEAFLSRTDFQYVNATTNRVNTLGFTSYKRRAVAAARKALPMGTAVVFAANKRGEQGAIGVAEELIEQLRYPLTLPTPSTYAVADQLASAVEYVNREFGEAWIGSRALASGVVLHHGDIPQETREVFETALRAQYVRMGICTSTLAEGVNLPIRTLVLYSVFRRDGGGAAQPLSLRDIKNLVGRAGRAGASTKGLVICANNDQWPVLERVARESPVENMVSALGTLLTVLRRYLVLNNHVLTNEDLDETPDLYDLIDGVDSTLVELAAEEITEEALTELAVRIADQTLAAQRAPEENRELLRSVFRLRALRVASVRTAGRLEWVRQSGAKLRMLENVERNLRPLFTDWDTLADTLDERFVTVMLQWSWAHGHLAEDVRKAYRLGPNDDLNQVRETFFAAVRQWIAGQTYAQIAAETGTDVDGVLGIYAGVISYSLQTVVEQGVSLISKLLESEGRELSAAVRAFPDYLRFGVPTIGACLLFHAGIRHRRAAIELGVTPEIAAVAGARREIMHEVVAQLLVTDEDVWRARLGALVYENTLDDIV